MPRLPPELAAVMVAFQPLFSKSVYPRVLVLLCGALIAVRFRTVTAALRVMGLEQQADFACYHRVLSQRRWCPRRAAHLLTKLLIERFVPEGPLVFGLDDTIERRWGTKIKARGIYRDPVRSSRGHFVKASGLRWLSVMLLVEVPWAGRVWALPCLTVLCPSAKYYAALARAPKTLTDAARQVLLQLARWMRSYLPERKLIAVADSSYSAIEFLASVCEHVTVVTRLRLDAALYEPAPPRRPGQMGRPRKKGAPLPKLAERLLDKTTCWQRVQVSQWYGQSERELEIATGTALWYHAGKPPVALRWVLVRDPAGTLAPKAFLSTDLALSALAILSYFVRRWQVEVTFALVRRHLGVETQRQWSDRAIARTTPCLLGLYSIVVLVADGLEARGALAVAESAWYRKQDPTWSDALAAVRQSLWLAAVIPRSGSVPETLKIPRTVFERFCNTLAYAA